MISITIQPYEHELAGRDWEQVPDVENIIEYAMFKTRWMHWAGVSYDQLVYGFDFSTFN